MSKQVYVDEYLLQKVVNAIAEENGYRERDLKYAAAVGDALGDGSTVSDVTLRRFYRICRFAATDDDLPVGRRAAARAVADAIGDAFAEHGEVVE